MTTEIPLPPQSRALPTSTQVGDLIVIHDTGAHSHSMGFQYNGKLRAPELLLRCSGDIHLIREREAFSSLFENTRIPQDLAQRMESLADYPYQVGSGEV